MKAVQRINFSIDSALDAIDHNNHSKEYVKLLHDKIHEIVGACDHLDTEIYDYTARQIKILVESDTLLSWVRGGGRYVCEKIETCESGCACEDCDTFGDRS